MVLTSAMIVSVIGLTTLLALQVRGRGVNTANDYLAARYASISGIELAMQNITTDAWRTERTSGTWIENYGLNGATCTVDGIDIVDGVLANSAQDSLRLVSTASRGLATYRMEALLKPRHIAIDALRCAAHSSGDFSIDATGSLDVSGSVASTNGALVNDGAVTGSVEANTVKNPLLVTGTITAPAPPKAGADANILAYLSGVGTAMAAPSTVQRAAIGPGRNPWGSNNADAVYVVTTGSDLEIRESRILGTLVVRCPGRTVRLNDHIQLQPYRRGYPTLVVEGDLELNHDSTAGSLGELLNLTNFNPSGVPDNGVTDIDTLDTYASEVQGLIYVTGNVRMSSTARVRGTLICAGQIRVSGTNRFIHDANVPAEMPLGFTGFGTPQVPPDGWRRTILP